MKHQLSKNCELLMVNGEWQSAVSTPFTILGNVLF